MSSQKIKFGDKEVDKKEFYSSKEAILLDPVDLCKIIVSRKWKISDTKYKYFCGYLNNDVIQADDKEVYKKYNEIWEVVRKLLKLKFLLVLFEMINI